MLILKLHSQAALVKLRDEIKWHDCPTASATLSAPLVVVDGSLKRVLSPDAAELRRRERQLVEQKK